MSGTKIANPKTAKPPVAGAPENFERRILILAPTGNDAPLTAEFLDRAGLSAQTCSDVPDLCAKINRGCGAIILAEETLGESSIQNLVQLLAAQPSWSDLPIILISSGGEVGQTRLRRLGIFGPTGNVTLLERPFRPATLISTVEVSLRSRQRQYESRDVVQELKLAHNELQVANQAKDDFLAALSHELRTPLNPALLIASESSGDPALPDEVRLNFETIRKNIELEARLIDDLLDLTRITTGKMILDKSIVDVHDILADAIATIQSDQQGKNIRLKLDMSATHSRVNGDAVRLQQVLWNVLKNAVKFTPREGTVTIETANEKNGQLKIKISDTGIGMNPDEVARVFNAFAQGDHASTGGSHRFGGLGLGLAISKNLVELQSGKITAHSEGIDRGSTFIIELPTASEIKNTPEREHASVRHATFKTQLRPQFSVLLVEDHEVTRNVLNRLLLSRNYKVTAAGSIAQAREIASRNKFDLLISDIGLPDGNGHALMKEFHDNYGLKGIALTGYGMEEDINRSKAAGFLTHLTKPVRIQSLENALALLKKQI